MAVGDGDLVFTGLDGGAPDVEVLASNIDAQAPNLSAGTLTYVFHVSQTQAGLASGVAFTDFHVLDIEFALGDNATLELEQVKINTATSAPIPEPSTALLVSLGALSLGAARRMNRSPKR